MSSDSPALHSPGDLPACSAVRATAASAGEGAGTAAAGTAAAPARLPRDASELPPLPHSSTESLSIINLKKTMILKKASRTEVEPRL